MNLPLHIARRYLFAKKSTNAVNWITGISSLGVMVGTAAMVVVLAAFAGLDTLVRSFYSTFDPDLKIIPAEGKFAEWTSADDSTLASFDFYRDHSAVVEDKALFRFREREYIATIKGVDANYSNITEVDTSLLYGRYLQNEGTVQEAVVGSGVAAYLGMGTLKSTQPLQVYVPQAGNYSRLNPMGSIRFRSVYPVGIFQVQPEFDSQYAFTSIEFARDLFNARDQISGIEIAIDPSVKAASAAETLSAGLGEKWKVLTRDDMQVAMFKVLQSEGLITYLVLTFILLVASFGILSSVNILILEKRQDIHTLWSMGANEKLLRRIFMMEGLLISLGGAFVGFVLGIGIVLAQQQFGLLSMGSGYVVEYYPVELRWQDLTQVLLTILTIGGIISWMGVRKLKVNRL